jgi:hypothetical protein
LLALRWERTVQNYLKQKNSQILSPFENCVLKPALNAIPASIGGQGLIDRAKGLRTKRQKGREESYTEFKQKREKTDKQLTFEYTLAVEGFYQKLKSRVKSKSYVEKFRMLLSIYSFIFMPTWLDEDGANFVYDNKKTSFLYDVSGMGWNGFRNFLLSTEYHDLFDGLFRNMYKLTDTIVADTNEDNPTFTWDNTPKLVSDLQPDDMMWDFLTAFIVAYTKETDVRGIPVPEYDLGTGEQAGLIELIMSSTGLKRSGKEVTYWDLINEGRDFTQIIPEPPDDLEQYPKDYQNFFNDRETLKTAIIQYNEAMMFVLFDKATEIEGQNYSLFGLYFENITPPPKQGK